MGRHARMTMEHVPFPRAACTAAPVVEEEEEAAAEAPFVGGGGATPFVTIDTFGLQLWLSRHAAGKTPTPTVRSIPSCIGWELSRTRARMVWISRAQCSTAAGGTVDDAPPTSGLPSPLVGCPPPNSATDIDRARPPTLAMSDARA